MNPYFQVLWAKEIIAIPKVKKYAAWWTPFWVVGTGPIPFSSNTQKSRQAFSYGKTPKLSGFKGTWFPPLPFIIFVCPAGVQRESITTGYVYIIFPRDLNKWRLLLGWLCPRARQVLLLHSSHPPKTSCCSIRAPPKACDSIDPCSSATPGTALQQIKVRHTLFTKNCCGLLLVGCL